MEWEDKVKDIENRFIALCQNDGVDEALEWLSGDFHSEAKSNAGYFLMGCMSDYFEELVVTKTREIHGD